MPTVNQDETTRLIKIAVFVLVRGVESLHSKPAPFNKPELVFVGDDKMIEMARVGYTKSYFADIAFEAVLGDCFRAVCPSLGQLFKDTREGVEDHSALFFDLCASFVDAQYAKDSREYYDSLEG